jgi:dipeptidyl aminopeptidase/acylaminoacyl peptidase
MQGDGLMFRCLVAALVCATSTSVCATTPVDVAAYVRPDDFGSIKLSPNGDYYAASVPLEGKSVLAIIRRSDNKPTAGFSLGRNSYVYDFDWVNPERVLISMSEKIGALDNPQLTGNLYAVNADGTGAEILVGQDVNVMSTGSHIQTKKTERIAAFLVDDLPDDDRNVLIAVSGFGSDSFSRVEKMDVYNGQRSPVAHGPVRNASYITDSKGVVRFAYGKDLDGTNKLFHRNRPGDGSETDWKLLNDESASGHTEIPLGFADDDSIAYLRVEQAQGPDAIVAFDPATGVRKQVFRDDDTDPAGVIFDRVAGRHLQPVGVFVLDGIPRTVFFDPASREAKLYRSLEAAFPGNTVAITSKTADNKLALVEVSSDRNAGVFYLFDTVGKKADRVMGRRDWFTAATAEMRPFSFAARDGQMLHGFVSIPAGSDGKQLPLVVLPHGGPYQAADAWGFDYQTQLLAAAGYAVLQVNFRGSTQYGRTFALAGAREWGGKMQDDVTDATRWAIAQGVADPGRICIFGSSYGGYAALMGAAREPALYKCAAGYVGVYDLPLMFSKGDMRQSDSGKAYLRDWVGEPEQLAKLSPVNLADRIKVPVFLAAGGEDERAPIAHSRRMEKALRAAGVPVETLYYDTEGHGFYVPAHEQAFYTQLLAFLARNIGGVAGTPATGTH